MTATKTTLPVSAAPPADTTGKEPTVLTKPLTTEVHPIAIKGDDVILRDPDHPDTEVKWRIYRRWEEGSTVLIDYRTPDGADCRHGFEDPLQWVTVEVRVEATRSTA